MSANHPSGIFIPDEKATPFTIDSLPSDSNTLTVKVGSWVGEGSGEKVGEDLQIVRQPRNGAWLLKVKYQTNNPQAFDDLGFLRRYFVGQNGWSATMSVERDGGYMFYVTPPSSRKESEEEAGNV